MSSGLCWASLICRGRHLGSEGRTGFPRRTRTDSGAWWQLGWKEPSSWWEMVQLGAGTSGDDRFLVHQPWGGGQEGSLSPLGGPHVGAPALHSGASVSVCVNWREVLCVQTLPGT